MRPLPRRHSHRHFRERSRPPQHRAPRHSAARGEVRAPVSPGEACGGNRAGGRAVRESWPHLLARGRRYCGAARAVPTGDGCTNPLRARCGDGGARRGAAGCGVDDEGSAPEDIPRGTSRQDASSTDAVNGAGGPEFTARQRGDAEVIPSDVPRGTFMRDPSRTVRRADAMAWMAERVFESGDAPARNRSPCRDRRARRRPRGTLRNRGPHRHRGGDRSEAVLRRRNRPRRRWTQRRTAQCRATHPQHSARGTPSACKSRPRVPLPRLPRHSPAHGHHVRHWANGGETSLDNLVLLCPTHHRLVHEGGFDGQRLDDGAFRFTNPYGVWPSVPRSGRRPRRPTPSSPERTPSGSRSTSRPPPRIGTGSASTTTIR